MIRRVNSRKAAFSAFFGILRDPSHRRCRRSRNKALAPAKIGCECRLSTRCGLLLALPGKSLKGHEDPFRRLGLSGRYMFG
jgi:hypothetical protein